MTRTSIAAATVVVLTLTFAVACGDERSSPTGPSSVRGFVLRGIVTVSGTDAPVSGATVQVLDGPKSGLVAATNAGGEYRFDNLPAGAVNLSAHAEGYLESRSGVHVDGASALNFALRPVAYAPLSGVVTNQTGAPLSGAIVTIVEPGLPPGRLLSATTDGRGEYRFGLVQIGETRVRVTARAYEAAEAIVHVDGNARLDVTLRRLPTVTLAGTVTDADSGIGISGATVTILRDLTTTVAPDDWGRTATTDGAGAYHFDNVTVGNANLAAAAPGYQERRAGQNLGVNSTLNFSLRPTTTPEVFTGQVGWTDPLPCVFQFVSRQYPCTEYPFMMRRTGGVDVVVTWQGGSETSLSVQLVDRAFGRIVREVRGTAEMNRRIAFSQSTFSTGAHAIRIVNWDTSRFPADPPPRATPIPFTLTLTRRD